jgi:hypothetical protein
MKSVTKFIFCVLVSILLLTGCDPNAPLIKRNIPVTIISDPPGAIIQIEKEYVGKTPLQVNLGEFLSVQPKVMNIVALPTKPGTYAQVKVFYTGDRIPKKLYFNMYYKYIDNSIDVNVYHHY